MLACDEQLARRRVARPEEWMLRACQLIALDGAANEPQLVLVDALLDKSAEGDEDIRQLRCRFVEFAAYDVANARPGWCMSST